MTLDKLRVELQDRSYNIIIQKGELEGLGPALKSGGIGLDNISPKVAVVSNPTVFGLYGEQVMKSLAGAGFEPISISVPDGEEFKTTEWVDNVLAEMLSARLDRNSLVVALGGGVIGDLAGFAASIYMRGIRFVQVPTTLLSQVDSSVGGKTGVNHKLGKNMIGTFWQPSLVWIDIETLRTLPHSEMLAGMAEVIKYGIIWDREFFTYLSDNREAILSLDTQALGRIIKRSCEIKAEVVSKDERESGLRAILNSGHTIGHAVETTTGYTKYLHGEAVAIGMYHEARLAEALGIADNNAVTEIGRLLEDYGLPIALPEGVVAEALVDAMALDKKTVAGSLRFVLPEAIGRARINEPVEGDKLLPVLAEVGA